MLAIITPKRKGFKKIQNTNRATKTAQAQARGSYCVQQACKKSVFVSRMRSVAAATAAWLLTLSLDIVLLKNFARADVSLDCDPCIRRDKYKLHGIFHGEILDPFWQQVEAAAVQSAKDMGVELDITLYDEFDPQENGQ